MLIADKEDTMPRSRKNGEQGEQVRKDKKEPTRLEPFRPEAEQPNKLRDEMAKFSEENPYPVLRIHRNGTVLYANKASEPLLKARDSGIGRPAPAQWHQLVKKALSSGQVIREETEHDGRVFAFRAVPIVDSDYVNFYGVDITERKRAEEALRKTTQTLEAVIQASPLPIFALDRERIVKTWNPAAERTFGWGTQEVIGRQYPGIPKEKMDEADALFSRALESGLTEVETLRQRKDGSLMDVSISAAPLRDSRGNINGVMALITDITERKNMEAELRKERDLARSLVETAQAIVLVLDTQGFIVDFNPYMEEISGYKLEEVQGRDWFSTFLPERDRQHLRELFSNAVGGIQTRGNVNPIVTKSGEQLYIEWYDKTLKDDAGNIVGLLSIGLDITDRKRAVEQLQEERNLLRTVIDHIPDRVYVKDRDSRFIACNKAALEFESIESESDVIGKTDFDLFEPAMAQEYFNEEQKVMRTGQSIINQEGYCTDKTGKTYYLLTMKAPLRDSHGSVIGLLGIHQDITERRLAEERLEQERNLLRTLIDHIPDVVYVKDKDSRFIVCNKALAEFWDKEGKGDIIGKTDFDLFEHTKAQRFFDEEQKVMQTGQSLINQEGQITDKTGNVLYGLTTKVPLWDSAGNITGIMGINRDITERKNTEHKLLEYQKQLKRLAAQLTLAEERERRRIAGELHDQVNQSLALAKIKLDSLHAAATSPPLAQALEDISGSIEKAIQNTRSLTFDLSYPILYELGFEAAVAEWLNEQVRDKHSIATEFKDDGQPKPLDDDVRVLLFRNVRELLINVIKYANADKVRVSIRRTDDSIQVIVEDNGSGFDPTEVKSMAVTRSEFGLLSIRERLEEMGGCFEIESKPGAGCKATMTAPLKDQSRRKDG